MQFKIKTYISFFLILSLLACGGKYPSNHEPVSVLTNTITNKETLKEVENHSNYTVATIVNCGQGIVSDVKTFTLFADYNNDLKNKSLSKLKFSGWNHTNNGSMTEWTNLKLGSNNYNFNDSTKVNSSCNNVNTLNMVLLKKVANWDHQHSNGFECDILNQGLKFGDIKNLVFDLRINSAKTNIPNVESIKSTYAGYVNGTIVDALDDGKVNIGITLGDSTNLNGSIIFQLDQEILYDKWVRVTIPMNKLLFYYYQLEILVYYKQVYLIYEFYFHK